MFTEFVPETMICTGNFFNFRIFFCDALLDIAIIVGMFLQVLIIRDLLLIVA